MNNIESELWSNISIDLERCSIPCLKLVPAHSQQAKTHQLLFYRSFSLLLQIKVVFVPVQLCFSINKFS
ncbi:hypothetical protein Sjap_014699 [Stephania japonica]|uniref:Uncharacterized protein n=1 Tax=Stephania japonica TaxID=461633 RepID=A0AAP0II36_9MAGN